MLPQQRIIFGMAFMRFFSASIEIIAAIIMLRLTAIQQALRVNATLGFVGPIVMISVTALGLVGLAGNLSYGKLFFIVVGICFMLYGLR